MKLSEAIEQYNYADLLSMEPDTLEEFQVLIEHAKQSEPEPLPERTNGPEPQTKRITLTSENGEDWSMTYENVSKSELFGVLENAKTSILKSLGK